MRKREFETKLGTLRYWMSENNEETAQLVFLQNTKQAACMGHAACRVRLAAICEAVCLRGEAWPRYRGEALHL